MIQDSHLLIIFKLNTCPVLYSLVYILNKIQGLIVPLHVKCQR